MARGWHGNAEGHRRAGRLGGLKSAAKRRRQMEFGEKAGRTNNSGASPKTANTKKAP